MQVLLHLSVTVRLVFRVGIFMDFQWHIGGDGFFWRISQISTVFPKRIVSLNHGKTLIESPPKKAQDPTTPGFAQGKPLRNVAAIFSKKYPENRLQPVGPGECWMIWMAIGLHLPRNEQGLERFPLSTSPGKEAEAMFLTQVVVLKIFGHFHPDPWGNDPIWRAYFSDRVGSITS